MTLDGVLRDGVTLAPGLGCQALSLRPGTHPGRPGRAEAASWPQAADRRRGIRPGRLRVFPAGPRRATVAGTESGAARAGLAP